MAVAAPTFKYDINIAPESSLPPPPGTQDMDYKNLMT